jgi:cytochrome c-type biogenesis protein CcmE
MKGRQKRMAMVALGMVLLGGATVLVLQALDSNLSYFFSPSEVARGEAPGEHVFRLGGLVLPGSVERGEELTVRFAVTDNAETINVAYTGILPDLFAEGQGVIAQGRLGADGVFTAQEVLAKHDETYMPPEVAEALQKSHEAGAPAMATGGMGK